MKSHCVPGPDALWSAHRTELTLQPEVGWWRLLGASQEVSTENLNHRNTTVTICGECQGPGRKRSGGTPWRLTSSQKDDGTKYREEGWLSHSMAQWCLQRVTIIQDAICSTWRVCRF